MVTLHRLWLRAMAVSSRPILIGPWRSEVGFEALYWLPWLEGWRARYRISKDRLVAVTRGGAGVWYDAKLTADLYDYVPIEKIRKAMLADAQRTGSVKQYEMAIWERKLLPLIAEDLGVSRYHVLHPSRMYHDLTPFWQGTLGALDAVSHLRFTPPLVPTPPLSLALPEKYVAVRFYARATWPYQEATAAWVVALVEQLAKTTTVVLLHTGLSLDDHWDFPVAGPNIMSLEGHCTAQNNLAVQSAVLAKSIGFVGTYGGTMQLAVRLGKPAIGFFQTLQGTCYAHKQLTEWLAVQQQTPCFIVRPQDGTYLEEVMRHAVGAWPVSSSSAGRRDEGTLRAKRIG